MSQSNRISGGLIDRSGTLSFTFDGRSYQGHPGDTLASGLLANGVRLMGRSFKYHRPRGPISAGSDEPNALVELRTGARQEPNTRATVAELFDGLSAQSQNRWPSLAFDALAINDDKQHHIELHADDNVQIFGDDNELRSAFSAPVAAHPLTKDRLEHPDSVMLDLQPAISGKNMGVVRAE